MGWSGRSPRGIQAGFFFRVRPGVWVKMACAAARSPADQDRLLKILQLQRFRMYAQQLDLMYFLRKIKCTLENGIVIFSTGAGSGSSSNRKMAASVLYSSRHVSQ
ncbi:signal recognition particle 19 kDa protein isoform X2 [Pseudorca crassidens]|uniref:signal recognition particle 19 kDa protein isoform X2 n=2 Tax=Delphinidae TaxID=9726 RepID=UPI00352D8D34